MDWQCSSETDMSLDDPIYKEKVCCSNVAAELPPAGKHLARGRARSAPRCGSGISQSKEKDELNANKLRLCLIAGRAQICEQMMAYQNFENSTNFKLQPNERQVTLNPDSAAVGRISLYCSSCDSLAKSQTGEVFRLSSHCDNFSCCAQSEQRISLKPLDNLCGHPGDQYQFCCCGDSNDAFTIMHKSRIPTPTRPCLSGSRVAVVRPRPRIKEVRPDTTFESKQAEQSLLDTINTSGNEQGHFPTTWNNKAMGKPPPTAPTRPVAVAKTVSSTKLASIVHTDLAQKPVKTMSQNATATPKNNCALLPGTRKTSSIPTACSGTIASQSSPNCAKDSALLAPLAAIPNVAAARTLPGARSNTSAAGLRHAFPLEAEAPLHVRRVTVADSSTLRASVKCQPTTTTVGGCHSNEGRKAQCVSSRQDKQSCQVAFSPRSLTAPITNTALTRPADHYRVNITQPLHDASVPAGKDGEDMTADCSYKQTLWVRLNNLIAGASNFYDSWAPYVPSLSPQASKSVDCLAHQDPVVEINAPTKEQTASRLVDANRERSPLWIDHETEKQLEHALCAESVPGTELGSTFNLVGAASEQQTSPVWKPNTVDEPSTVPSDMKLFESSFIAGAVVPCVSESPSNDCIDGLDVCNTPSAGSVDTSDFSTKKLNANHKTCKQQLVTDALCIDSFVYPQVTTAPAEVSVVLNADDMTSDKLCSSSSMSGKPCLLSITPIDCTVGINHERQRLSSPRTLNKLSNALPRIQESSIESLPFQQVATSDLESTADGDGGHLESPGVANSGYYHRRSSLVEALSNSLYRGENCSGDASLLSNIFPPRSASTTVETYACCGTGEPRPRSADGDPDGAFNRGRLRSKSWAYSRTTGAGDLTRTPQLRSGSISSVSDLDFSLSDEAGERQDASCLHPQIMVQPSVSFGSEDLDFQHGSTLRRSRRLVPPFTSGQSYRLWPGTPKQASMNNAGDKRKTSFGSFMSSALHFPKLATFKLRKSFTMASLTEPEDREHMIMLSLKRIASTPKHKDAAASTVSQPPRRSVDGAVSCHDCAKMLDLPPRLMKNFRRNESRTLSAKPRMRRSISQPMHINRSTKDSSVSGQTGTVSIDQGIFIDHSSGVSDDEDDDDTVLLPGNRSEGASETVTRHGFVPKSSRTSTYSSNSSATVSSGGSVSADACTDGSTSERQCLLGEALWDHVTMQPEELAFRQGDVIELLDAGDGAELWFGCHNNRSGWFPSSCVRLLRDPELCDNARNLDNTPCAAECSWNKAKLDRMRANVVQEIVMTERDYVKLLENLVDGFLNQARQRPELFSERQLHDIFGNLDVLYQLHQRFLADLEQAVDWSMLEQSQLGICFLRFERSFEIYSDYCNNHPQSSSELARLYMFPRYRHFFEACRLLRDMDEISLDGFLLSPVQRICKYPLQLSELVKCTAPTHGDHMNCHRALDAMRAVAKRINERKRRLESLHKICAWQSTVERWQGPDLLQSSTFLVYSGDVACKSSKHIGASSGVKDVILFLFDHLLVICKRDLLKRSQLIFKDRLCTDGLVIAALSEGKDLEFGVTVRHAFKIHSYAEDKSFLIMAKSRKHRQRWLQAFSHEREVAQESANNPNTEEEKRMACSSLRRPYVFDWHLSKVTNHKLPDLLAVPHSVTVQSNLAMTLPTPVSAARLRKAKWNIFSSGRQTK